MNYEGKFGTQDPQDKDSALNDIFLKSEAPDLQDSDEALESPYIFIFP